MHVSVVTSPAGDKPLALEARLRRVFAKVFEIPEEEVTPDLAYRGIPQWDSVAHMALVAAIDTEFGTLLETDDVLDLSSFAMAVSILKERHGIGGDGAP
jgi:acyl carrier protein